MISSRIAKLLRSLSQHPLTRLVTGLSLAATGIDDLFESLGLHEGLPGFDVHNAVILLGVVHSLKALGDVIEGMDDVKDVLRGEA